MFLLNSIKSSLDLFTGTLLVGTYYVVNWKANDWRHRLGGIGLILLSVASCFLTSVLPLLLILDYFTESNLFLFRVLFVGFGTAGILGGLLATRMFDYDHRVRREKLRGEFQRIEQRERVARSLYKDKLGRRDAYLKLCGSPSEIEWEKFLERRKERERNSAC